jgi:predicted Rossmann-fold nucleotide-binding protein
MQTQVNPVGNMNLLSQAEIEQLQQSSTSKIYQVYRNCSLAVLNAGSHTDDAEEIYQKYQDFEIQLLRSERGVKLALTNPPSDAFVDGKIIKGIQELLSSVLRDILFTHTRYQSDAQHTQQVTDLTFDILRNANVIIPGSDPNLVTCWGGHSINHNEYRYTKDVGYQLGLRGFNICTGCGPGAMKGPMKGATIAHAKQRNKDGRYIGLTEPSIIAAEPPNPIVNELVIMPDIEKRLEAFVRMSHGIVIFPGGAGTAEELLYILGIMLNSKNQAQKLPIILTQRER